VPVNDRIREQIAARLVCEVWASTANEAHIGAAGRLELVARRFEEMRLAVTRLTAMAERLATEGEKR
jgi:hypothetical protein